MRRIFTYAIAFMLFTSTAFSQSVNLDEKCVDLPYLISGSEENQDCPLTICIYQSIVGCPEPNECSLLNNIGYKTCSTIEHKDLSPFSQICYYEMPPYCASIGCELKVNSITISRGVLGETITLTGTSAQSFIDIIFNSAIGNVTLGSFTLDCNGDECNRKYLNISNLGGGGGYRLTLL